MMLNSSKPPFDDPIARQAVAYGRNVAEVNQIRNRGIPRARERPVRARARSGYAEGQRLPGART